MYKRKNPNYNDKIKAISSYFNVSENAAKYMFHRRRRGYPWKKEGDSNYLKWSIPIQNAFVKADNLGLLNWGYLKFSDDLNVLLENGIDIEEQSNTIYINKNTNETDNKYIKEEDKDGGWTVVTNKKSEFIKKHLLRSMGFLPQNKIPRLYKNSNNKTNDKKQSSDEDTNE